MSHDYDYYDELAQEVNYDNDLNPSLNFESELAELVGGGAYSIPGENGLGAGEPGLDVPADFFVPDFDGPQASGNEGLPSYMFGTEYADGFDENLAHIQFQSQDLFPGYGGVDSSNEHLGQFDIPQPPLQDFQFDIPQPMVSPKAFSNITTRRSPPLSVDTSRAAAYNADQCYESDVSMPVSNPPSAISPVQLQIVERKMNDAPAHALKRRGSTELVHGKIKRNTRRKKGDGEQDDARFLSEQYYGNPPPPKEAWGPIQKNGRPLFSYNRQGELAKGRPFKFKEMKWYLFAKNPGNLQQGKDWIERKEEPGEVMREAKSRSGLTLWVGWTPAQVTYRYPNDDSNKCKFYDCAFNSRTIKTGDPRVIFDERHNINGEVIDPFYNAAYCHLYCLEKHFDLEHLFDALDVRLDNRYFVKEEVNLSALKPDEEEACKRWVDQFWPDYQHWRQTEYFPARQRRDEARGSSQQSQLPPAAVERFRLWQDSLTRRLIHVSLSQEPKAKVNQRVKRRAAKPDSCDRETHQGDLDFANQAREKKRGKAKRGKPKQVGEMWDEFQFAKQSRSVEIAGATARSTKRPRCDEQGPGADAEMLHPTKRRRQHTNQYMDNIGVAGVPPPMPSFPDVQDATIQDALDIKLQQDLPPENILPLIPWYDGEPQVTDPEAMVDLSTYQFPDPSSLDFTAQDDAVAIEQEGGDSPTMSLFDAAYGSDDEVKADKDDTISDCIKCASPPRSPGAPSSPIKRKRDVDDDEEGGGSDIGERDIKRRCSESSR